jgi:hypothetical protein
MFVDTTTPEFRNWLRYNKPKSVEAIRCAITDAEDSAAEALRAARAARSPVELRAALADRASWLQTIRAARNSLQVAS